MRVILVVVVAVGAVGALDTSNLTGEAILNRLLDEVLEDVPEPRLGISRTQWVMTGSMSETWSQFSSTSGSTFGGGVAEYYGAGAAASISGPDGIMRTRYNSLYPGFGFTGEWIMLPRQHKRFQYESQYKHSNINVNVLMSQLWASVILRDNIVTVFGYILNRPSNFLSEELYTSLYHVYDAIRLRRVQIYGLIHVLQDVCFGSPTEQFLYIFQGLKLVVPRYLLGAVQIWIDTLRLEPQTLDEVMRPNGGPLVVDFLAGIESSAIRILGEPIEWNPFTAPKKNAVLSNSMGPVFVEIFAALEAGSLALTQALFGLILINRPLNEVIPEKDETERYLVDILRLGNVESWENIIKPVTNKDRGDPEILIPKVLTQISVSKDTDVLIREEARYIIPYLKPPSNTYANKYYNTVSPVLSKPSIDLLLLLKSITKVEYPLEVVEDKDRIVHFILDGHLDIEFIVKGFNRFDHDTPINVLIALLTRIERRLPKLPPEIISSVRSLQLYLIYKRFLCSMSSTIPTEFLDISSLINAFANVRVPTHVYVLVQKLAVTLPYEEVPWQELIKKVSIEECTRPRKCVHHFFKLLLQGNYIKKGPSFKILVELMGYLNENGDPWEMVTEEKSTSPKYCVPLPQTTERNKMTTTTTKPWPSTWGTTRHMGHTSTPSTVTRHRSSTVRTEPTEEGIVTKGTPRPQTAEQSSNTEPCDEDVFTMEATTETQPRRKQTTARSTERTVSSTRHRLSTVPSEPTTEDECEEANSNETPRTEAGKETSHTESCDEDIFTMEETTETQPKRKHTTARSTETTDDDDTFTSSTHQPEKLRSTEEVDCSEETEQARYPTTPSAVLKSTPSSQSWKGNTNRAETVTDGDRFSEAPKVTGSVENDCSDEKTSTESRQPTRTTKNVGTEDRDVECSSESSRVTEGGEVDRGDDVGCSKEELHQASTSSTGRKVTTEVTKEGEFNTEEFNGPGCDEESTDECQTDSDERKRKRTEEEEEEDVSCKGEFTTEKSRQTTRRSRESEEGIESTDEIGYSSQCGDESSDSEACRESGNSDESVSLDSHSDEVSKESRERCDTESGETSVEDSECGGDRKVDCSEEEKTQKGRTTPRDQKITKHLYPKSSTKSTNEDECSDGDNDVQHSTEKFPKIRQTESTKKVIVSTRKVTSATTKTPRFSTTTSYTKVGGQKTTKKGSTRNWKVTQTTARVNGKCYGTRGEEIECSGLYSTQPSFAFTRDGTNTEKVSAGDWKYSTSTESSRTRGHTYSTSKYVPGGTRSTGIASTEEDSWLSTATTTEEELYPTWTEKSSWPRWSTPSIRKSTKSAQLTSPWTDVPRSTARQSPSTSSGDWKHSSTRESSRTRGHTYSTSKYVPGDTRSTEIASTEEDSWISTATTPEEELYPTWTDKSSWPQWSTPSRKSTKSAQLTSSWTDTPRSTARQSPSTSSGDWKHSSTTESSRTRGHTYSTSKYVPGGTRSTGIASTEEDSWLSTATTTEEELYPTWTDKSSWPHWSTPSRKSTKSAQLTSSWTDIPRSTARQSPSTSSGDWKHSSTTESSRTRGPTYSTSKYVPGGTRSTETASTEEESWLSKATTPEEDELHPTWTEKSSWPHWSTPFRKSTTTKPAQLTSSWTEIPSRTTTQSPFTSSWPGRTVTWARNFTTTRLPVSWSFPTRAQSTRTTESNSWTPWQKWTPTYSKPPTTNRADATTSRPHVEFTRTLATTPWEFNLNGSWSVWNGTFIGTTRQPSSGLTDPWPYLNASWTQWNGTWSHWNFSNASFTTGRPYEGTQSWKEGMPNITWPKLNFTTVVGFGAEMNWSLSYLLRESKIFTSEFVIEYVKKIHSTGRYSIQYLPTPQEIENAKFPSFDVVQSMEPPSVEHPETCLVPTQYGTLEDFKLKPLRFLLSSPELYQYLGPDFNPGKYSTKGELLLAILERFVQIQSIQTNTNIYSYISNYINFIRDSKKAQGPSVTINFVSLLNALPFAVSEQEVRYLSRITDFMTVSEFYKILGPTFNPSKYKTRGPMLKYTFEFMMTLSLVQEDKFMLEALRYFVGKIYMQGYGGQAVEWVLIREVDQVQSVDVRSVFRAINHDKLSKAALQAESNVLNFIFNEFIPSVHFQDFKLSHFKTKGLLLQGAFRYLLTQNTVNPKVKADIITLMPYIRFDGPGVEPVDFDPFSR